MDRGTETGVLAAIHTYLRAHMGDLDDPLDSIVYGPSTSNQVSYFSSSACLLDYSFILKLKIFG